MPQQKKISIIKEPTKEKPYIIIYKPKELPSAPLNLFDKNNALYQVLEMYPEVKNVIGKKEIEYGLIHRLDTKTDGLMIIAANQSSYDYLIEEQSRGGIKKYYKAQCDIIFDNAKKLGGFPELSLNEQKEIIAFEEDNNNASLKLNLISYFRPYGKGRKEVRPVTPDSSKLAVSKIGNKKLYETQITICKKDNKVAIANCLIKEGYRHQVRNHLAWAGFPVKGDLLYNFDCKAKAEDENEGKNARQKANPTMKFSATKIEFEYPRGDLNSYDRKDTWT